MFNLCSECRDLGRHMDRMFVLFVVGEMEAFEPGAKKEVYLFPKKHDIS